VLQKVSHSEWATPVVAVPKRDGKVRVCGDYRVTINQVLDVDQYPLPRAKDLFITWAGGKHFTTLNLSHAYNQLATVGSNIRRSIHLEVCTVTLVYCLEYHVPRSVSEGDGDHSSRTPWSKLLY